MKAILAAAALVVAGTQADAAVYEFQFVVTSGSTENINLGTGRFSIEAPTLANLSIFQNAIIDTDNDVVVNFGPPIISTPFGMAPALDPLGSFFEVYFDSDGMLSYLLIGSSELSFWNYYTLRSVQAGREAFLPDGSFGYEIQEALGYWTMVQPSPVPLPASAALLLAALAGLAGYRRFKA